MKSDIEWFLVANATRARILRGLPRPGEAAAPELVMRATARKLRDIMADKPGRSFSSASQGRRGAIPYTSDPVAEDERNFVREVVALLETHRLAGDFDRLTVLAAPQTLGLFREEAPPALRARIRAEIAKNLAGIPEGALPAALRAELESH